MTDLHAIADRFEIEALRGKFVDACMMRDYDWLASLFTPDGAWRMPDINVEFVSREEIRAGIEGMQDHRDYFMPNSHLGTIQLDGDTATGSDYICEFGQPRDGGSQLQYSLYYDHYQRTPDGWKFTERVYSTRSV